MRQYEKAAMELGCWMRERAAAIKAVVDVVSRRDPTLGRQETSVNEAVVWTREHRR